jgi:hypothetical protein
VPDDVVFVDAIPLGATGKMLKTRLREQLKDYTAADGDSSAGWRPCASVDSALSLAIAPLRAIPDRVAANTCTLRAVSCNHRRQP